MSRICWIMMPTIWRLSEINISRWHSYWMLNTIYIAKIFMKVVKHVAIENISERHQYLASKDSIMKAKLVVFQDIYDGRLVLFSKTRYLWWAPDTKQAKIARAPGIKQAKIAIRAPSIKQMTQYISGSYINNFLTNLQQRLLQWSFVCGEIFFLIGFKNHFIINLTTWLVSVNEWRLPFRQLAPTQPTIVSFKKKMI